LLAGDRLLARASSAIAEFFGARSVWFTDSGTSALRVAVEHSGTEQPMVALPAYSCYDIATAAVGARARVLLYDVDPRTLGPDVVSLRSALAQGARVVVVAGLYGYPPDMRSVREICDQHGALLIEDAAQGALGRLDGRLVGTWGSISVLSFGRGKGMTGGGGGALLVNDDVGNRAVPSLGTLPAGGNMGAAVALAAQWIIARPAWYGIPASLPFLKLGETIYHAPWEPGSLSTVSAGALTVTLRLAEREAGVRKEHAARLVRVLTKSGSLRSIEPLPGAEPGFLRLPVVANNSGKSVLSSTKARDLGIMPGYPKSLNNLEGFRDLCVNRDAPFPGAERLAESLFTLPTHSLLTKSDLDRLESVIGQV
jgi:dTDP-4-amino-4,6-dideoxygalactose transaminase